MTTSILDAFTEFKQKCTAIEGIATTLVEIYKSFLDEKIKIDELDKTASSSSFGKKTLLHDKPYAFSCPRGSPLDRALNKVESAMMKYWEHVREMDSKNFIETLSTANSSLSFVFIV